MPVKIIFIATFSFWCFAQCNSPQNQDALISPASADTTLVTDTSSALSADSLAAFPTAQERLNEFIETFKMNTVLPAIQYESAYEYDAVSRRYHFDQDKLVAVYEDLGVEGGGGGQLRILLTYDQTDKVSETILYLPYTYLYGEKGYFSYADADKTYHYEVTGDFQHPVLGATTEEQTYEYESDLTLYRSHIRNNKSLFTESGEGFTWDIKREKVDSEYGEVEVYELLWVSKFIFEDQF